MHHTIFKLLSICQIYPTYRAVACAVIYQYEYHSLYHFAMLCINILNGWTSYTWWAHKWLALLGKSHNGNEWVTMDVNRKEIFKFSKFLTRCFPLTFPLWDVVVTGYQPFWAVVKCCGNNFSPCTIYAQSIHYYISSPVLFYIYTQSQSPLWIIQS